MDITQQRYITDVSYKQEQ